MVLSRRLVLSGLAASAVIGPASAQARPDFYPIPVELLGGLDRLNGRVSLGSRNPDVTIVEFFDYNCGFCKRGLNDIKQLVETDKNLRVILKDLPILSEGSKDAAAIAYALKKQVSPDTYWKFHFNLMGQQGRIGREEALGVAKSLGVDMKRLEADLAKPGFEDAVEETKMIASALGINGTPSYVVAEDIVVGARGYDALASRIANFRKCKKAEC